MTVTEGWIETAFDAFLQSERDGQGDVEVRSQGRYLAGQALAFRSYFPGSIYGTARGPAYAGTLSDTGSTGAFAYQLEEQYSWTPTQVWLFDR